MILRNSLIFNVRYMMAQKSDEVRHSDQGRAERSEATPWFTQTFILVAPKEKKHYEIPRISDVSVM